MHIEVVKNYSFTKQHNIAVQNLPCVKTSRNRGKKKNPQTHKKTQMAVFQEAVCGQVDTSF